MIKDNKDICFIIDQNALYFEKCLVDFDIPIFYVCTDTEKNRYIILCYDSDEMLYLVAKSSNDNIAKMLGKEITMKQIFEKAQEIWRISIGDDLESDKVESVKFETINVEDLPAEDSFFEIASRDIRDYYDLIKCESEGFELKNTIKDFAELLYFHNTKENIGVILTEDDIISSDKINVEKKRSIFWTESVIDHIKNLSLECDDDCFLNGLKSLFTKKKTGKKVCCYEFDY